MKSSREQFEASWLRRGGEESDLVRYPENHHEAGSGNVGGQYVVDDVQGHWQTWQASRAAIEIALPDCDDYQSTWQYQDAAEIKLKGLGLSVK